MEEFIVEIPSVAYYADVERCLELYEYDLRLKPQDQLLLEDLVVYVKLMILIWQCDKNHTYVCSEYILTGTCSSRNCKLRHPKKPKQTTFASKDSLASEESLMKAQRESFTKVGILPSLHQQREIIKGNFCRQLISWVTRSQNQVMT